MSIAVHIARAAIVPFVFFLGSCTPVKFATDTNPAPNNNITGTGGPPAGAIDCSPLLNGAYSSVTLNPASANPDLAANCTPTNVNHIWTVTRAGSPVTINGLIGGNSTPDFQAAGPGVYLITLDATAVGWTSYHLATPLQVTVVGSTPSPAITCDPKINGTLTSITLSTVNPNIAANCNPASVGYQWTVLRNGVAVTVAGMSGSASTPDFLSAGPGTYEIWLAAQATGYTSYTATSPLTVVVPSGGGTTVNESHTITAGANKVDILLVIDDSSSMLADNQRLASRLQGFVNDLAAGGIDWQMCVTLTRAQQVAVDDDNLYWGASVNWSGNPNSKPWVLKAGTSGLSSIFANTIDAIGAGWLGTEDERAIKAAWWHLWHGEPGVANNSECYRTDAALSVIILSDEDERSIGGDESQVYYSHEAGKALEIDDLPQTYVNYVKSMFGPTKKLTVNSIIVRPNDTACLAAQDAEGSKAHYGVKYNELSQLTGGYVGSICDTDYSTHLKYFKDTIVTGQASITLQCNATAVNSVTVTPNYAFTTSLSGNKLNFNPQIPVGSTVQIQYVCP